MSVLEPGQLVAGRYRLESEIGEGAMGSVFRAEDETLKRQVAIKFLFVKGARDPRAMIEQFLREARIAASVQHRNVIHTVDFGTVDDQPFMVMELLNGESLGARMAREPALGREQLLHLVSLTLRGLAAVHDAGIVHRDLKPQNVFLQRDAEAVYPKILDFGISRSVQQNGERASAIATTDGLIIGTPDYMSPEQARGEADIDKRSDIYSMGVLLYEGLSGRLPFQSETVGELIVQIVTLEPPRLDALDPAIPRPLADVVAQAMAKQRDHRFPDARAMRKALVAAMEQGTQPVAGSFGPPPARADAKSRASDPTSAQATWGDFEGLGIVDNSPPALEPAAQTPARERRPSAATGEVDSLFESNAVKPARPRAQAPSKERVSSPTREERPSAERASAATPKRAPARAASSPALDDALDPLYAGSDRNAPDIDYVRAGPAARKAQPLPAAASPRARVRAERARFEEERKPEPKPSQKRTLVLALVLAGLLGALYLVRQSREVPPEERAADPLLSGLHLSPKARRENPGKAPAHMRDVVFH